MNYCRVINNQPQPPQPLPQSWANVSNFPSLSDAEKAGFGWYPFIPSIQPNYNQATYRVVQELQFTGTAVKQVWTVVALTPDEQMAYLRQQRAILKQFLDRYMDSQVAPKDYDSILTACTWINSSVPEWKADALAANEFRQLCFLKAYQIEADVLAGKRPVPTETQFQMEMPILWNPPALPPSGGGMGNGTLVL